MKNSYRFHLIGLAHLPQSKTYLSCAFTQKNRKLAKMLTSLGHTVYFYGAEGSDVEEYCKGQAGQLIFVQTHTLDDIRRDYGEGDNRFEIGYDWTNKDYKHDFTGERKQGTLKFYAKAVEQINKNKQADDFLLCTQGYYHKPIADTVGIFLTCESGIGYRGSVKGWFRAFESSYIQNYTYGYEGQLACINGSYYDRVIPNYFDPDDVVYSDTASDYYLFIGRMIKRKGIITASLACKAMNKRLIIVGQGASVKNNGHLVPNDDPDFDLEPATWEYQGFADVEKRKELMSHAIATFTPTEYLEIFGGTHAESMLHGTPPITTNFGVYGGTIPDSEDGRVGFRCNTLQDFVDAGIKAQSVDRSYVRKYGEQFLMGNVKLKYQKWFDDLHNVWESTIDKKKLGWHRVSQEKKI